MVSLSKSIIANGRITTTKDRAKNARSTVERLISLGKDGGLSAKRRAHRLLGDHRMVSRLFNEIAPKFKSRIGGYTRIILLHRRRGDNAQMCLFELTEKIKEAKVVLSKEEKQKAKPVEDTHKKTEAAPKKIEHPKEKEIKLPVEGKPKSAPEEKKQDERIEVKKKPSKNILGGLRHFFKKERDSL